MADGQQANQGSVYEEIREAVRTAFEDTWRREYAPIYAELGITGEGLERAKRVAVRMFTDGVLWAKQTEAGHAATYALALGQAGAVQRLAGMLTRQLADVVDNIPGEDGAEVDAAVPWKLRPEQVRRYGRAPYSGMSQCPHRTTYVRGDEVAVTSSGYVTPCCYPSDR